MLNQKGFTIVELMIVLTLSSIMAAFGIGLMHVSAVREDLRGQATLLVDTLRRAQWQTMNGHNNAQYGIHFDIDQYVLFQGTVYDDQDDRNIISPLPGNMEITIVDLEGGGSEVVFERPFGATSQYGSIQIESRSSDAIRTVLINSAGMIDAN